ncbi:hypothetical protein ACFLRI_04505, partial [Bacteroidota bacterium]
MKQKLLIFVLFLLSFTSSVYTQTVATFAGVPKVAGATSVAANRLSAHFTQPYGVVYDSKGNMWISEEGNSTIAMVIASNQEVRIRAGGVGLAGFYDGSGITSRFNAPSGIAIGPNDEIYVADKNNHVIRKIEPFTAAGNAQMVSVFAGKYTIKPGQYDSYDGYKDGDKSTAQFSSPTDVACDASGNVYVADKGNHVIRKITPNGDVSTFAGQAGNQGNADGNALSQALFNSPVGVFVKGNDVYVADQFNSSIRKISGGQVSTVVSGLWTPMDVWVDSKNDIYITDFHRVRKYDNTYAGSSQVSVSGFKDGDANSALFNQVKGICMYGGAIYVADMDNHIIRKISQTSSTDEASFLSDLIIYPNPASTHLVVQGNLPEGH